IATVREPLVVLDTEGTVVTANAAYYRVFGAQPRLTEGARFYELEDGIWNASELRQLLDAAVRGDAVNDLELTRDRDGGARRVLLLSARRIVDLANAPPLVLLAIDDVTASRQAEIVRRQRVAELAAADQSKNEFLAMLAHELRNPLAPIRSATQILGMKGIPEASSEKARLVIERQVQTMTRLIEDLLDVARITQGKIELRKATIDVRSALRRAVEVVQPEVDQRGQTLSLVLPPGPATILGDLTRLEQAFGNLLQNASKFTGPSGHIWVTAEIVESRDESTRVLVRVRDDGIGIPSGMLHGIFDLFKQAGTSPHHATGLGVGLALVDRIVRLHSGDVTVSSAGPNRGSEFTVALPAAGDREGDGTEADRDESVDDSEQGRRILVVDDNVDAADSLAELLRLSGHEVRVAHSGPAALELAAPFLPQIIFLDIAMPRMDGYEVARRLRRHTELNDPVIVALTGFGRDVDRQMARAAGFDELATKPLHPDTLRQLLKAPR
ncbi:MAG: ATP-binding protein, partial [Vicinamibacterales bacterium]